MVSDSNWIGFPRRLSENQEEHESGDFTANHTERKILDEIQSLT